MAQQILTKRVPFNQVALLILFSLPSVIAMAAPFASLVGTLMTVGRLTSDNEVLVILSSGLSYRNIFVPALIVGTIVSLLSFFANDVLLPAGTLQFRQLYRRIVVSTPALELEANSVKRFRDTIIVTGDVTGTAINNVLILDRTSDGERRVIMAKNAELRDAGTEGLSLDLLNAFIQSSKELARLDYDYASSSFLRYWVPQEDMIQAVSTITPGEMSSLDVFREIRRREESLKDRLDILYNKNLETALSLEESLRNGQRRETWNRKTNLATALLRDILVTDTERKDRTLSNYWIEFYKKFSLPFGAFSFVFLAVSLGLYAKKSGQTVGFIFGIFIAVIYWALFITGQTMGTRLGYSPFWTMWFPDILAIVVGLVLCVLRIRK
jgi:lipopolysaccharide export system permease protein